MAMLYYWCENGECRMILLSDKGGSMLELSDVKKQNGTKVEQTKIREYGE